jgi:hypothetical protein
VQHDAVFIFIRNAAMSYHDHFENLSSTASAGNAGIERLARRRASAKMGWFIHALVYVCVNAGLALMAWQSSRHVPAWPLAGWGLGLAIHGMAVWLKTGVDGGLYERQLKIERDRLQRRSA